MSLKFRKLFFLLFLVLFVFLFSPIRIYSADPGVVTTIENPLNSNEPIDIIANIIKVVLGIIGSIALLIIFWGGWTWMTSAGNPEKVKKGMNTILWAALGLLIIFSSYAILRFVFQAIGARGI